MMALEQLTSIFSGSPSQGGYVSDSGASRTIGGIPTELVMPGIQAIGDALHTQNTAAKEQARASRAGAIRTTLASLRALRQDPNPDPSLIAHLEAELRDMLHPTPVAPPAHEPAGVGSTPITLVTP